MTNPNTLTVIDDSTLDVMLHGVWNAGSGVMQQCRSKKGLHLGAARNCVRQHLETLLRLTDPQSQLLCEGNKLTIDIRKDAETIFMADELDGAYDFLKYPELEQDAEFSVAMATIENNVPTRGVIYQPAQHRTWFAMKGRGAYVRTPSGHEQCINVSRRDSPDNLRIIASRKDYTTSHDRLLETLDIDALFRGGSFSIRAARVAEGFVDFTYEPPMRCQVWGLAPVYPIIKEAGGEITDLDGKPINFAFGEKPPGAFVSNDQCHEVLRMRFAAFLKEHE